VIHTLFEASGWSCSWCSLFLQNWRASLIPLLAIPVSLVGRSRPWRAGFSLNMLSLFGLVLAIGIVVDDAIVVVENVERHIADGLSPREATRKAMEEVTGAVIAIAFGSRRSSCRRRSSAGISGQFYRQFALTIAVATLLSAFNSLTLSPRSAPCCSSLTTREGRFGRCGTCFGGSSRPSTAPSSARGRYAARRLVIGGARSGSAVYASCSV
jgi:multidrug efflux pump